ncbi:hypothetical protein M9Y10_030444 [Tritrichomonas musculus]|uniref:KilA-N domain-containing protein n=1 Tax=Tritrichomonas musculus TaxID=1915356 RepID=A0ABR2H386_9EUKA
MSTIIRESISCGYEYIQYNNKLRIVHSIDDDMYQVQSIISACKSDKRANEWYRNQETKALLNAFDNDRDLMGSLSVYNKINVPNGLRGLYVHRLLVNAVAMWASPRYALQIYKLLDEMASAERKAMESTIQHQRPRMVPKNHEHDYRYLIWRESMPSNPNGVILHLVRRSKSTFDQVRKHYENDNERWFYRDNLPISMSVNKDIKEIVKNIIPAGEYEMTGCDIRLHVKFLDRLYESFSEYFDEFQK